MPNYTSSIFTPQATIIPQSAGDIEEARIKRLTDLANLNKLQKDPIYEARRLALAQAGLDEASFYHQGQLKSDARGQDITLRGQDVQIRGQDIGQKTDQANDATARRGQDFQAQSSKDSRANEFIRTAFARPDIPLPVLAQTAADEGHPALANAFATGHGHDVEGKAQKAVAELSALKTTQKPEDYAQVLAAQTSDPEVRAAIQKTAPHLFGPTTATSPGASTYDFSQDPEIAALNPLVQQQQASQVAQAAQNTAFLSSRDRVFARQKALSSARRKAGVFDPNRDAFR